MRACDHQLVLPMSVGKVVKGRNRYLGDNPYLGKPIAMISREEATIPATPQYNPLCK
jgi:hypothetical protein